MKKLLALSLALIIVLSVPLNSYSAYAGTYIPEIPATVVSRTRDILKVMEPEKEMYGLAGVDFDSLCIGERIPAYILKETGLESQNDITYYPIMSDFKWVATAFVSYDSHNETIVQVSVSYAKEFLSHKGKNSVAILFDADGSHLLVDEQIIGIALSGTFIPDRIRLKDYDDELCVPTLKFDSMRVIPLEVSISIVKKTDVIMTSQYQHYLSVPCIQQPTGTYACWAASIASIRGYYGTTTTVDDVYDFAGITKYNGVSIYVIDNVICNYGFNTTWYWDGGFNWLYLTYHIYNDEPFFVRIYDTGVAVGHAVVLRGYYTYPSSSSNLGIIVYMDPATGNYAATNVANDGDFFYNSPSTSNTYRMSTFLAVY